jgi:hypothetical protein
VLSSDTPISKTILKDNLVLQENLHPIREDYLVHMYKDTPIFVDFLNINDANNSFFRAVNLQTKKCKF